MKPTVDRGDITRVWLPLVAASVALGFVYSSGPGPRDQLRPLGLGLGIVGLSGVILARYTLGRSFAIRARAVALVTQGIYSRIRNPIYFSSVVFIMGLLLMVRRPAYWLVLLLIIPMQAIRARAEARVLEEKFGDAYREYRKRTWF